MPEEGSPGRDAIVEVCNRVAERVRDLVREEERRAVGAGVSPLDCSWGAAAGLTHELALAIQTATILKLGEDPADVRTQVRILRVFHGTCNAVKHVLKIELGQADELEDFPWPSKWIGRA